MKEYKCNHCGDINEYEKQDFCNVCGIGNYEEGEASQ